MAGHLTRAGISARLRAMSIAPAALGVLIALSAASGPAAADDHRRGAERGRHEGWHGDIHRFNEHDLGHWRSGRWYQGRHSGRSGWWWIVGGVWYYYPAPVYPYPNPYQPPMLPALPAPPSAQFWYYCPNPPGYYPYVPSCASAWQRVPANPPPGMPR